MRYVIKSATGYFTEMAVQGTKPVTLNGNVVGHETQYLPQFEAFRPTQAAKFDAEADALASITSNPTYYGGPEAFSGCTVEPTEA